MILAFRFIKSFIRDRDTSAAKGARLANAFLDVFTAKAFAIRPSMKWQNKYSVFDTGLEACVLRHLKSWSQAEGVPAEGRISKFRNLRPESLGPSACIPLTYPIQPVPFSCPRTRWK
jgi:hypothetical protein